jgi:subtilisin family serine protease
MAILSLAILGFAACKKDSASNNTQIPGPALRSSEATQPMVANEVLLKFKEGTSEAAKQKAFAMINGHVKQHILTRVMKRFGDNQGIYLVHSSLNALEAIAKAKSFEGIDYAEPNYIYTTDYIANDAYFVTGQLWGMNGTTAASPVNQYGCGAATAWAAGHTGSSDIIVGIIDEGVMHTHPELAANIWSNPNETLNGIDDDNNGYVDDVRGWDFVHNDNSPYDGATDDHATHVAGTIGAVGNNTIGVAGVNWNVKMISCKFLGGGGGSTANAILAVDYLTDLKLAGINIVAANNSWGGGGYSSALATAISNMNAAGVLFIAAAGNNGSNNNTTASYPSNYNFPNVISVASIKSNGAISSFSNYGNLKVHLAAPGEGIISTVPAPGKNPYSYASYSGTSMATPHVTGAAALYKAYHPTATASDIKNAILSSVTPTTSVATKTITGGRLNISGF